MNFHMLMPLKNKLQSINPLYLSVLFNQESVVFTKIIITIFFHKYLLVYNMFEKVVA